MHDFYLQPKVKEWTEWLERHNFWTYKNNFIPRKRVVDQGSEIDFDIPHLQVNVPPISSNENAIGEAMRNYTELILAD